MLVKKVLLFVAVSLINCQSATVWASAIGPLSHYLEPNCDSGDCYPYRFLAPADITAGDHPIVGGIDHNRNLVLYSCRASIDGDIIPGKATLDSSPKCWVSYEGKEYALSSGFEVLTNPDKTEFKWQTSTGIIPDGAVAAGITASGETLYVARCSIPGQVTPGKLKQNTPNVMYYAYGGIEFACSQFDVLVK